MTPKIKHISAVTFAVRDMARSLAFYSQLGFEVVYGGSDAPFSTLQAGEAIVNLTLTAAYEGTWWGRAIFRVDDVDAYHQELVKTGLSPDNPKNADWGERFFQISDPDSHELSFAEVLQ